MQCSFLFHKCIKSHVLISTKHDKALTWLCTTYLHFYAFNSQHFYACFFVNTVDKFVTFWQQRRHLMKIHRYKDSSRACHMWWNCLYVTNEAVNSSTAVIVIWRQWSLSQPLTRNGPVISSTSLVDHGESTLVTYIPLYDA